MNNLLTIVIEKRLDGMGKERPFAKTRFKGFGLIVETEVRRIRLESSCKLLVPVILKYQMLEGVLNNPVW